MSARRLLLLAAVTFGLCSGTALAATLGVATWHLWAGSQTLTKGTCTLSGTAATTDTWVDEQSPAATNAAATTLTVRPRTSQRRWAFVRFDLSSCNIPSTGGADSATLSVRVTTAPNSSRTIDVTPVLTTWDGTLSWTGAQTLAYGTTTASFATGTANNVTKSVTVTGDVDDLIKNGSASFGWRLGDAGASANVTTTLGSSENATAANRPQLQITYEK